MARTPEITDRTEKGDMTMTEILPTFSDNKDRIVYLLAEYKIPLSVTVMASLVWLAAVRPDLPTPPPRLVSWSSSWAILAIPSYGFGKWLVNWVRERYWPTVFHINAVEDIREKWNVPPETWEEKEVEGDAPNLVNDNSDFEVKKFDWFEDTEKLVVEGTWLSEAADSQLVTDRSHMEAIHGYLLDAFEQLSQLRGTWSDQAIELQQDIINSGAEARERGLLVDENSAKNVWEKYVDAPEMERDVPSLSDAVEEEANLGEPIRPVEQEAMEELGGEGGGEAVATDGGES